MSVLKFKPSKSSLPSSFHKEKRNVAGRALFDVIEEAFKGPLPSEETGLRLATPGGKPRLADKRMLTVDYFGFKIRVWQVKESIGTIRPKFYGTIANLTTKSQRPARVRGEFASVDVALVRAKLRIEHRLSLLSIHPAPTSRNLKETTPAKVEVPIIEAIVYDSDFPIPPRVLSAYREYHDEETDRTVSEFMERVG